MKCDRIGDGNGANAIRLKIASIPAHFSKILFDSLLAFFEGFPRRRAFALKRDQKNQPTEQKRHAADYREMPSPRCASRSG